MAEFAADDFAFISKRHREIRAEIARETGCEIKQTEQVKPATPPSEGAAKPATSVQTGSGGGFKTPSGEDWSCGFKLSEAIWWGWDPSEPT